MELTSLLGRYGFTEKEAKIYLAALEVGTAPASSLARRARENRVTVYSALKSMKQRGIVYETQKGGITYYGAVEPQQLLVEEQQKLSLLEQKMPEFMALMNAGGQKPKVQYFEGLEGLKLLYMDLLTSTVAGKSRLGDMCLHPVLEKWLYEEFLPKRVQQGLRFEVIVANNDPDGYYYTVGTENCIEKKHIAGLFGIHGEIMLYGPNKVALSLDHEDEMMGLIIHSKQLYDTLHTLFSFIWNSDGGVSTVQKKAQKPTKR